MKTNAFTSTVLVLSLTILVASCRSSRNTGGNTGGSTSGKSYPVYRDPNPTNLPPGQAKKIYGDKSAKKYAPGQRKKQAYPLIIRRTPDIIIGRSSDGRNFYRNPAGFYYWEGSDARFYLDEKHMGNISYNKSDYDDWKGRGNGNDNGNGNGNSDNAKSKGNGKGKGNGNGNGKGKGKH